MLHVPLLFYDKRFWSLLLIHVKMPKFDGYWLNFPITCCSAWQCQQDSDAWWWRWYPDLTLKVFHVLVKQKKNFKKLKNAQGKYKKWTGKEGKEKHFRSFFGAITAANGSHLSQLDIWENLWLRRREGHAEVNEERVLRRGLWWGWDDTMSLQQWEVKGKNNMCL